MLRDVVTSYSLPLSMIADQMHRFFFLSLWAPRVRARSCLPFLLSLKEPDGKGHRLCSFFPPLGAKVDLTIRLSFFCSPRRRPSSPFFFPYVLDLRKINSPPFFRGLSALREGKGRPRFHFFPSRRGRKLTFHPPSFLAYFNPTSPLPRCSKR